MAHFPNPLHVKVQQSGLHSLKILLIVLLIGLWIYPWSVRLKTPNIIHDDVVRIENLQTLNLASRVILPINEHLVPCLEMVTTLTWWLIGCRLALVPLGFTIASYIPFLACLAILWLLVRHETASPAAAWMAATLFAATPIYAECVYWFSASSFTWALLFTLLGFWFTRRGKGNRPPGALNLIAAAICCFLAPLNLAIGVLSGPATTIRGLTLRYQRGFVHANGRALIPLLGTVAFLALAHFLKHEDVVSRSIEANGQVIEGLYNAARAPAFLVLAGYLGVPSADVSLSHRVMCLISLLGAVGVFHCLRRGSSDQRRWLLIGSFLILGGYGLIYTVRLRLVGPESLIRIQRYHLFPCTGLVILVTTCLASRMRRLDSRPLAGLGFALAVALGVILLNRPLIRERVLFFSLQSEQRPVMKVLDHLAAAARSLGVNREQVLQALDPIEPRWCYTGGNILSMLPETAVKPLPDLQPLEIRKLLLSQIPHDEQASLFSCTNLTGHIIPAAPGPSFQAEQPAAIVGRSRLEPTDHPGHYLALGWPNFLEFHLPRSSDRPVAIGFCGLSRSQTWELSWANDGSEWSKDRVVVLRPARLEVASSDLVLPLESIPGLDPSRLERLRLGVRERAPVTLKNVYLIR